MLFVLVSCPARQTLFQKPTTILHHNSRRLLPPSTLGVVMDDREMPNVGKWQILVVAKNAATFIVLLCRDICRRCRVLQPNTQTTHSLIALLDFSSCFRFLISIYSPSLVCHGCQFRALLSDLSSLHSFCVKCGLP